MTARKKKGVQATSLGPVVRMEEKQGRSVIFQKPAEVLLSRLPKKIYSISQCFVLQTTESITDTMKRDGIIAG